MYRSKQFLFALLLVFLAVPVIGAQAADSKYLFERNKAQFGDHINKVESRSYKFLAAVPEGKDAKGVVTELLAAVKKAAADNNFAFKERKKGEEWRFSEKWYYDTPNRDLYKKGYVIRENYRFDEGAGPDPDKFVLTVKEMSPNDLMRLVNSKLGPVPGSDSLVKFEENISLTDAGQLQSYFETAIGSKVKREDLGQRTLGDYAKLYPELANLGVPLDTKLEPVKGYSVQLKYGGFILADGSKADGDIEVWTETPGGKPYVAEIAFDGEGYGASVEHMKAEEDFFNKMFGQSLKGLTMPNSGPYMGSKVRTLFDEKHSAGGGDAKPAKKKKNDLDS